MRMSAVVIASFGIVSGTARARYETGAITIRPEVGGSVANTFGIAFGGAVEYPLPENLAFGPFSGFSTAGPAWEGRIGQTAVSTRGSDSLFLGGYLSFY